MIQRRERLGFAREAREALGIVRKGLGKDLDRDVAIQPRIEGAVHLAHPALADLGGNFIRTETGARKQGHVEEPA